MKIWIDGQLLEKDQAKISVFDHGLLYGDGVFEGIRVYSGNLFQLEPHLIRLYESAKAIRLDIPTDIQALAQAVKETVNANDIHEGYVRLIVTRGVGNLGLDPFQCEKPTIIIIADNIQLYPEQFYEKGMKVISSATIRSHPMSLPPQIKSLNYLNNICATMDAVEHGVQEALMFNHLGYLAEASGDNVFIIKNQILYTPTVEAGSLNGITRALVMKLAREQAMTVIEKDITRFELYVCDECFLTGTAAEVIGVVEIDGRQIGDGKPGPVTKQLRKLFYEYARSQDRTTPAHGQ